MKTIIIIAIVVAVAWFLIKKLANTSSDDSQTGYSNSTPLRPSGCLSSLACQHMNLGKAKEAGYDTTKTTFCRSCNSFVSRIDNCSGFCSKGCESGICAYADNNKGGQCYCKLYKQTVSTRQSCPDYIDFFETSMGKSMLNNLN